MVLQAFGCSPALISTIRNELEPQAATSTAAVESAGTFTAVAASSTDATGTTTTVIVIPTQVQPPPICQLSTLNWSDGSLELDGRASRPDITLTENGQAIRAPAVANIEGAWAFTDKFGGPQDPTHYYQPRPASGTTFEMTFGGVSCSTKV